MSHETKDCWGPCEICAKTNHKNDFCRFKTEGNKPSTNRANKANEKKRNRKLGKLTTDNTGTVAVSEEESEEDTSEEDSPKKPIYSRRYK